MPEPVSAPSALAPAAAPPAALRRQHLPGRTFALLAALLLQATPALAHKAHEQAAAPPAAPAHAQTAPGMEAHAGEPDHAAASPSHAHEGPHDATGPVAVRDEVAAAAKPRRPSNAPGPLAWLGRFHPPLVHFPIALLTVAAGLELAFALTRRSFFGEVALLLASLGGAAAVAAAVLGWLFAGFYWTDEDPLLTWHRWLGTTTAFAGGLALLLARGTSRGAGRRAFRIAVLVAAALVGITGFLGGALIYGLDHYAW